MDQINARTASAFEEARQVVAGFEKYGYKIILSNEDDLFIGNPREGMGREPMALWWKFRRADRQKLHAYLRATGRVQYPAPIVVPFSGMIQQKEDALFDLCRRCVEALTANDAIYEAVPAGVNISDEVSDEASAHYDAVVVPLLSQIEKTPATTLAGFVAKARVLMHDGFDTNGEHHLCCMGAVMLNDLSGLDLVPEVPEAPHHYKVVRSGAAPAATQEAA